MTIQSSVYRWYRQGTVAVTNGSTAVTGTTTAWSTNVKAGDGFSLDGATWYEVASVTDNTHLVLASNFGGSTTSGASYAIDRRSLAWQVGSEAAARVLALQQMLQQTLKTTGQPPNTIGSDGAVAYDATAMVFYTNTGGTWDTGTSFRGSTVLNGAGAPSSGTGNNADFYLDTTNTRLYGPKTGEAWGGYVSLVGPGNVTGPASSVVGNLALFDNTSGTLLKDGGALSAAQQSLVRANVSAAPVDASASLGLCANPFFEISQENGTTLLTASGSYAADQWFGAWSGSMSASLQQVAAPFSSDANYKRLAYGVTATITTAQASLGASDHVTPFHQRIEGTFFRSLGWGTADAQSVDVVAIVKASVAGTYAIGVRNSAANRTYLASVALSAGVNVVFVTVPGDTSGTWLTDTGIGCRLHLNAGAGSSSSAAAGSWMSASYLGVSGGLNMAATLGATLTVAYCNIFPHGVLPWSSASEITGEALQRLINMRRPIDEEIRRCQRYFYAGSPMWRGVVLNASTVARAGALHPVKMRAAPAASLVGTVGVFDGSTPTSIATISANYSTTDAAEFDFVAAAAVLTVGRPALTYNAGGSVNISSRM